MNFQMPGNGTSGGIRRGLSRTQSTANKTRSFIKYAKLGDEKNLLSMLRQRAQADWEFEGERQVSQSLKISKVTLVLGLTISVVESVL